MKASVKLRDGKEPLLRAKLPLSMFGVPFSSGVNVGSSNELGVHISTLFDAGPLCRVTFRPNDSHSPLRLMLKAGIGAWGSPNGASFVMSAELNVPAQGQSPSLSFFIKPRVGDFGLCKDLRALSLPKASQEHSELTRKITKENGDLQRSPSLRVAELAKAFVKPEDSPDGSKNVFKDFGSGKVKEKASPEFIKERQLKNAGPEDECVVVEFPETGSKETFRLNSAAAGGTLKGWNLIAQSSLPLGPRMLAGIRWRMKIPSDFADNLASDAQTFLSCLQMPVLALDKISLESREPPQQQQKKDLSSSGQRLIEDALLLEETRELNRVASMCASMRRQLHLLHSENQVLRNTMEEMRSNLNHRGSSSIFSDKSLSKGLIERAMVAEPEGAASDGLHGNWNEGKMDKPLSRGGGGNSKDQVFEREATTTQATRATRADGDATNNNKGHVLGGVASEPQASDIAEELKKAIANNNLVL